MDYFNMQSLDRSKDINNQYKNTFQNSDILYSGELDGVMSTFMSITNNHEFKIMDIIGLIQQFQSSVILKILMTDHTNIDATNCLDAYLTKNNRIPRHFRKRLISIMSTKLSFNDLHPQTISSCVVQMNLNNIQPPNVITKLSLDTKLKQIKRDLSQSVSHTYRHTYNSDMNNFSTLNNDYLHPSEVKLEIPSDLLQQITNSIVSLNDTIQYGNKVNENEVDTFIEVKRQKRY